jgi:hypothetical protein
MKWTFHPANKELTTSLPLEVVLSDWQGTPRVSVDRLGEIPLTPEGQKLVARFYVVMPGRYEVRISDGTSVVAVHPIEVAQHTYLDFTNEFGFFFILFLFVMGGIALWTITIMRRPTGRT